MELAVFNGSPRGEKSNTRFILDSFLQGFMSTEGNRYEQAYLLKLGKRQNQLELFKNARHILLAFPLYGDAMPFVVKSFIESLEPHCSEKRNQDIGFIVQSGFPETIHSCYLEKYLAKLALRLHCSYKGTVIKGGAESITMLRLLDNIFLKWFCNIGAITDFAGVGHHVNMGKLKRSFFELGKEFGVSGEFNKDIVSGITEPDRLGRFSFWVYKFIIENLYWNLALIRNNSFAERFAKPLRKS